MKTKIVLTLILFLAFIPKAMSLDITAETKELCNKAMMDIFDEILVAKIKYPELKDFDQSALTTNDYGIYVIKYKFQDSSLSAEKQDYEFVVTIVGLNDPNIFSPRRSSFDLGFPLLNLRFTGYKLLAYKSRQYDVEQAVQRAGQVLWDSQQKYMPYQLKLEPVKSEYKVGEEIGFTVSLQNKTQHNIIVKDLSDNTLFFLYNNKMWGASEVNPSETSDKQIILKPGESIKKAFRGPPVKSPKEFEIYASYGLTYEGVKPSDSLKIKVVPSL
jgi:hypothetical protein